MVNMTWKKESERHKLAKNGIKTSIGNVYKTTGKIPTHSEMWDMWVGDQSVYNFLLYSNQNQTVYDVVVKYLYEGAFKNEFNELSVAEKRSIVQSLVQHIENNLTSDYSYGAGYGRKKVSTTLKQLNEIDVNKRKFFKV
jgi:hypothetical protein